MPTYNYKCPGCGNSFSIEATIPEKEGLSEKVICPKCGSKNIRQEFSSSAFVENVFNRNEESNGCCTDKNVCDIRCQPDETGADNCKGSNNNSGCCG